MILRTFRRSMIPSRTLARYMVKMHLTRFFGMLLGLTVVLQMLDLLATADDVMAAEGATWVSIVSYVSLRAPQLISQFAPFAALIATLLTLATLNQSSEVTVMKASGLSAHRILLPLGLASLFIGATHFVFNEAILVDANADLEYWQDNDYAVDLPPNAALAGRVWLREGNSVVVVESVSRQGNRVILDQVSIFERDQMGRLEAVVKADFAWFQNNTWTLHAVNRFDANSHLLSVTPTVDWAIPTRPERFVALNIKADQVSFLKLWDAIQRIKAEGLPTDRLMTSFQQKIAGPAATLLMPLLAAVAAFGVSRGGGLVVRLVFGMALGFSFFVADNFMLAMGEFGVAPPFLAAWAPFFLFLFVGYTVIFYTEEGRPGMKAKPAPKTDTTVAPAE